MEDKSKICYNKETLANKVIPFFWIFKFSLVLLLGHPVCFKIIMMSLFANTENMQDAAFVTRRGASHFPSLQAGVLDRLAFRHYFY